MQLGEEDLRERLGEWTKPDAPVYAALAAGLARLIEEGAVPVGARLPAERRLARALAVSRGTVVAAYDRLREQGVVRTRHGSGTLVEDGSAHLAGPRDAHLSATLARNTIFSGILSEPDDVVDLRGAYWFGADELDREAFRLPRTELDALLEDHGYHPTGLPALRAAIAARLSAQGLPTVPEQVLVTTGAQQAITLVAELSLSPGDRVVTEDLTFPGALDAFAAAGARVRTVPIRATGPEPGALRSQVERAGARLAYLVPVHNPLGTVLPTLARRRLAETLADWDGIVVEDLTLAETQQEGAIPPPMAAFATGGAHLTVLTIGSLSKVMWGGLRVGWVRGSEGVIGRLARLKALADLGTPLLDQAVAARLLADADTIRARRVEGLAQRRDTLAAALAEHLPEWRFAPPRAGLCLWVQIPGMDGAEFAALALRHGVAVVPGVVSAPGGGGEDRLRIAFGQRPPTIEQGVRRLAAAWREARGLDAPRRPLGVLV